MIGINIVSVVILLGVLIFVHELGHFLVAKRAGVGVLKFSLGFGPRIIGKKIGETEYLLSLIPLGGYVKLLGESPGEELSAEEEKRSFLKQPVRKRIGIVAAGPVFNLLLAILIFTIVNMIGLPVLTAEIGGLQDGSAALNAGLKTGDRIIAIDGGAVTKWDEISEKISASKGKPLLITIQRDSLPISLTVTPKLAKTTSVFGEAVEAYKIGISPAGITVIERKNPLSAFWTGLRQTWMISRLTVVSVVKMFQGIVSPKSLGGPIMIAQIAGSQVKEGIVPFILFMALLSINLAILNLLPVPVLDGGHLLFYLIEGVTGHEVNLRWREMAQQVGFFILILLMIFVFMMDIERLNIKIINDFIKMLTG
ncbi:MAG: RIP metalloprotease RseP [Syntrophus sp. (in: bacteria)]|nr:RIP metalloprotease RseP [Syntrophus sp. (in: bacteria)]